MASIVESWHVAYTKPNAEAKVEEDLRRANYATLLLWERVRKRFRKRGQPGRFIVDWVQAPLYPGYVFLGCRKGQGLFAANEIDGISQILSQGETPIVVPHKVIDELSKFADVDGVVRRIDKTARRKFQAGETVTIKDGTPLGGFIAKVSEDCGKEVKVWLRMIGTEREVSVAPNLLIPAGHGGY